MSEEFIDLECDADFPCPLLQLQESESWLWGDYFMLFQNDLKTFKQGMHDNKVNDGSRFPYTLSVFDSNKVMSLASFLSPFRIFALCAYEINTTQTHKNDIRSDLNLSKKRKYFPFVLKSFRKNNQIDHGVYYDIPFQETVRNSLFDLMREDLKLKGEPEFIGTIDDLYNDPRVCFLVEEDITFLNKVDCMQ